MLFDHATLNISIHALHEESDLTWIDNDALYYISIHALHEESDRLPPLTRPFRQDFNPRSP